MHSSADVDIIVVTHNSERLLPSFVSSVREAHWPDGAEVRIHVVDNESTDATLTLARSLADELHETGGNPGFGAAVNLGVSKTTAPYLLLANVDVRLLEGGWSHALGRLAAGADVVAPAIVDAHLASPGPFAAVRAGTLVRTHFARKEMRSARLDFGGDPALRHARIDGWPCGACFLIRRDAFEAIGGYDVKYFLYFEETDLFARLTAAGRRLEWVPEAAVLHVGGGDVANSADRTMFDGTMMLGKARYFTKNRGRTEARVAKTMLAADCTRHAATWWLRGTLRRDPHGRGRAATWMTTARATLRYELSQSTAHLWRADPGPPPGAG